MTDPAVPQSSSGGPPPPGALPNAERVRLAYHRRDETDYIFSFWTALGWTILTFGIFGLYVLYQLVRRSRDHNLRRLELLDASVSFAWERAVAQGVADELRPNFERAAGHLQTLRAKSTDFRDPIIWVILAIFTGIATYIAWILLDGDLVKHDHAEGGVEAELAIIFDRLGRPIPAPDPGRLKGPHNYIGRILVTLVTCGLYALWWLYDLMVEGNRHFEENWRFDDAIAGTVYAMSQEAGSAG
ncbi:MAG TPA: hypothetical protein VK866_02990 [Acidimicrobiales bacterium]|nr:hypothetical protein [Acidimicrobiales bacterium]